jgi:hypothetical protein
MDDQPRAIVRLDLHHVAPVAMNSARRARPMAVSAAWWIAPGSWPAPRWRRARRQIERFKP